MKTLVTLTGLGIFLGLLFVGWLLETETSEIEFLSLESKTETGGRVWNQIRFLQRDGKDIWLMNQKHELPNDTDQTIDWPKADRLAIVVDTKKKTSQFYQLKPGALEWTGPQDAIPLKARCYACHSSGPRAIRPNYVQQPLSLRNRLIVEAWNLRVKLYGQLQSLEGFNDKLGSPFRSNLPYLERPLNLSSCTKCHSENGIRAPLKKEHLLTSAFLVKNKMMPPFPFQISEDEKVLLMSQRFYEKSPGTF